MGKPSGAWFAQVTAQQTFWPDADCKRLDYGAVTAYCLDDGTGVVWDPVEELILERTVDYPTACLAAEDAAINKYDGENPAGDTITSTQVVWITLVCLSALLIAHLVRVYWHF